MRSKRLQKEIRQLQTSSDESIKLLAVEDNFRLRIEITGAADSLYSNEKYVLQFVFPDNYPTESPTVTFVGKVPIHPHIYKVGHICLSTLGDDWTPIMNTLGICLSIISMMSSAKVKESPPNDNDYNLRTPPKTGWWYDDNNA